MRIVSPGKRVGSKSHLAPWICSRLPAHRTFVEVFGGTAAVLIRKPRSDQEVYNDLDTNLVNLWTTVRDTPLDLCWDLAFTPYSRSEFERCSHSLKTCILEDAAEWARQYSVLTRQGFVGGGGDTWSFTKEGHLPSETCLKVPESVIRLSERLQGVVLEHLDYPDLLRKWDAEDTCFYFDPPYQDVEQAYYTVNKQSGFDHQALRDAIQHLKGSVVVSYYRSAFIDDLYRGFEVTENSRRNQIGAVRRKVTEVLLIRRSKWAQRHARRHRVLDLFAGVSKVDDGTASRT